MPRCIHPHPQNGFRLCAGMTVVFLRIRCDFLNYPSPPAIEPSFLDRVRPRIFPHLPSSGIAEANPCRDREAASGASGDGGISVNFDKIQINSRGFSIN